jgi:cytochrome c
VAHIVYDAERPEEPAIAVAVPEEQPAAGEEAAAEAVPIANLLANANPEAGQAASRACQACHTFEQGGANKVGPNLWNVVGAPIAAHEGFAYSDALKGKSGETWTYENLNAFIQNPRGFAPGTKMTFGGMRRDDQRADLIAYLRSLSDNPQPLPQPAAEAPAESQAPASGEAPAAASDQGAQPAPAEQPAAGQQPAPGAQQTQPSQVPQPATGAQQPAQ